MILYADGTVCALGAAQMIDGPKGVTVCDTSTTRDDFAFFGNTSPEANICIGNGPAGDGTR